MHNLRPSGTVVSKPTVMADVDEHSCLNEVELTNIEYLNVPLHEMKAESINFWLGKFVQEVRDKKGQRYI